MAEKKTNLFILLGLLSLVVLIPLLKAKPSELEGEVVSTQFERVNGILK